MFQPGKIKLEASPLALVVLQVSLQQPIKVDSELRTCLRTCGLERLTKKLQNNVSVNPTNLSPVVQKREIFVFLSPDSKRGLSISEKQIAYFKNDHSGFNDLLDDFQKISQCLELANNLFETISLRYVNAFKFSQSATEVVEDSLGGLNREGLGKPHHHHNYEFWCETEDGRLHTRFSTDHGDRTPKQLGDAEAIYPSRFRWSYDEHVGHLDIFETSKPLSANPVNHEGATEVLRRMNLNVERAFINSIKNEVMSELFKAKQLD